MDNAANAIVITDMAGIIQYVNPAFEKVTGYTPEEAMGKNPSELVKSNVHDKSFYQNLWSVILAGNVWKGEIVNRRKDGAFYTEETTIAPVKNAAGEIQNFIAIKQDISDKKKVLEELNRYLNEKKDLIREIYHRTKNNMQVIISMFSLQSSFTGDERLDSVLKDVENRIRAMSLVHEKLFQSRNLSRLNLKDYLTELVSNILQGYAVSSDKIAIVYQMQKIDVLIDCAIPCGLVVNELISNIAKHAFPGGRAGEIKIDLSMDSTNEIKLVIEDNGAGMGMNLNLESSRSMGLLIVKKIVEFQMKGKIELDNTAGIKWIITFKDKVYKERV